jgi:hypothetical protein
MVDFFDLGQSITDRPQIQAVFFTKMHVFFYGKHQTFLSIRKSCPYIFIALPISGGIMQKANAPEAFLGIRCRIGYPLLRTVL